MREDVKKHDIYIKPKSYKLECLESWLFNSVETKRRIVG